MIKRIVYESSERYGYWQVANGIAHGKNDIAMLYLSFKLQHSEWVFVDKGHDEVIIVSELTKEEYFNEEDLPTLIMSRKNYDEVINALNENRNMPKQYLVLSQDDFGWIYLEAKDELSELDLISIEQDQKAGQEWEVAWKKRASEHKVKQLLRYWHYELRCLAIKVYKKVREFFEDLFLI
ncbi:hypothetical protein KBD08_01175 [Candidatus Babeliales bacterium]|nr:hypothetical protein [Candidatus Babeliales bacterium]